MIDNISLMITDDHALVRQGIRAFLELQPDLTVLGEADSGEVAVRMAAELVPDVMLMDLVMPGIGGVEATRQVKQVSPHSQVIVLTSYHEDEYIFPALRAGALSYVLKDVGPDELADTVRKAARGESVLHPRVAARVVQELRGTRRDTPNLFTDLSDRELEVLRLIADGLSNAEIANKLIISEKTVKGHVSNILGKLHMMDRTQAAVYAWQQGLVARRDP
ncbi:MAG TPA: response regulator transcription factor [Ktedonobacteraceae bacterium]|nr:response regulator transcription factor [Ktedonobacteraceae bacterium]